LLLRKSLFGLHDRDSLRTFFALWRIEQNKLLDLPQFVEHLLADYADRADLEVQSCRQIKRNFGRQRVGFIALNGKSAVRKAILVCHFFKFSGCHG